MNQQSHYNQRPQARTPPPQKQNLFMLQSTEQDTNQDDSKFAFTANNVMGE
jgi:hypothetical protein